MDHIRPLKALTMQLYKLVLLNVSIHLKCEDALSGSCVAAHTDSQNRKENVVIAETLQSAVTSAQEGAGRTQVLGLTLHVSLLPSLHVGLVPG